MNKKINSFEYKPGDHAYEIGTAPKIYYSVKGGELNKSQKKLIQETINQNIKLNLKKNHNMIITLLGKDHFNIVIDNKTQFSIITNNDNTILIQQKYTKNLWLQDFKDYWKSVTNFLYKGAFSSPVTKKRSPQDAVRKDYRSLRKGLELGQAWLTPKKNQISVASYGTDRSQLQRQTRNAVQNAKKIDKALHSSHPQQSLDKLIGTWSDQIVDSEEDVIIPIGYLKPDGTFQPVMLRFYMLNENDEACRALEIYSDNSDEGSKVHLTAIRHFAKDMNHFEMDEILKEFLKPLIPPTLDQKLLEKTAKTSPLLKENQGIATTSERKTNTQQINFTYAQLIKAADNLAGDKWIKQESRETIATPKTSASRITEWFDHLIDQSNNKFTTNEKLNLLYFITEKWSEDQLRQIKRTTPLEKKLEVYQDVLGQINHTLEKIAVAINVDIAISPEHFPKILKERKAHCQKNIEKITLELRRNAVESV